MKIIIKPRLNYEVVLGTDMLSENIIVQNFANKGVERIAIYEEVIKIDDMIKKYFNKYDRINRFKYSKSHSLMVINSCELNNDFNDIIDSESSHINPTNPVGL